jgi:hypothetical protein
MLESRILRERMAAIEHLLDAQPEQPPHGAPALFGTTTTVAAYPAVASAFYAVVPSDIDGTEAEGVSATYVGQSGALVYAWNAGTAIPPSGTPLVAHAVGGRWVFRYDG